MPANGYPGNKIPNEVIEEKAKKLNVKILNKFSEKGHTYLTIKCLVHKDKPERKVELYNFLNRDKTCGCMLQRYTIEDLKNNPKVRGDLEIIGEYKNNSTPILCKCKICGLKWYVTPNKLTQGRGCPACHSNKISSGERLIFKFLKENDIVFEPQKTFADCINSKTNKKLKFDFYLPDQNICIEYQGKQHYEPVVFRYIKNREEKTEDEIEQLKKEQKEKAEKNFIENKNRDNIKKKYCKENNIKLIEIKYTEQKDIENILNEIIK